MQLLGLLLTGLFGGAVNFLVQYVTRKVAVAGVAIGALATVTGVLLVAFNAIINPFASSLFSTAYGQALGLAFPPVAGNCLTALSLSWTACALYSWQVRAINLAAAS